MIIISIHKIVVSRNFLSITVVLSCFICSFSILKDSHLDSDVCSYGWHFMIASISFVRKLDHGAKKKYLRARKFSCGHVSGAPNDNIAQNHLNIALLNVF